MQKAIFIDPTLQAFFLSFCLNSNLHEIVNITLQALFLSLKDLAKVIYRHRMPLSGSEMRR